MAERRWDDDPDAPPKEAEVLAATELRDALATADEADPVVEVLRSAWTPHRLDERVHSLLFDAALDAAEDAARTATLGPVVDQAINGTGELASGERAAAARLRDALDDGRPPPIVEALVAAWNPGLVGENEHAAMIAGALAQARGRVAPVRSRSALAFPAGVAVTSASALAFAAAVTIFVGLANDGAREAPLARTRSTQPLFAEPFRSGEASARIDRIAVARASDFRDNRFARWGVR